jgi:hypothetical protein
MERSFETENKMSGEIPFKFLFSGDAEKATSLPLSHPLHALKG